MHRFAGAFDRTRLIGELPKSRFGFNVACLRPLSMLRGRLLPVSSACFPHFPPLRLPALAGLNKYLTRMRYLP